MRTYSPLEREVKKLPYDGRVLYPDGFLRRDGFSDNAEQNKLYLFNKTIDFVGNICYNQKRMIVFKSSIRVWRVLKWLIRTEIRRRGGREDYEKDLGGYHQRVDYDRNAYVRVLLFRFSEQGNDEKADRAF